MTPTTETVCRCRNCGDAFEWPERPCPKPSPGVPYVDCGRGGHVFVNVTVRAIDTATDRQREVYAAICACWRLTGRSPSIRELCDRLGIAGPNAVVGHLRALKRKGLVVWDRDTTARGIWPAGLKERIAAAVTELEATRESA